LGVSSNQIKSPLPGFSAGAQKIIEKAIEKNDLDSDMANFIYYFT